MRRPDANRDPMDHPSLPGDRWRVNGNHITETLTFLPFPLRGRNVGVTRVEITANVLDAPPPAAATLIICVTPAQNRVLTVKMGCPCRSICPELTSPVVWSITTQMSGGFLIRGWKIDWLGGGDQVENISTHQRAHEQNYVRARNGQIKL